MQPDSAGHGLEGKKHMASAIVPAISDPRLADRNIEVNTEAAYKLIAASMRIGGHPSELSDDDIDKMMAIGWLRDEIEHIRTRGRAGDRLRADESVPAAFRRTQ